MKNLVNLWNKLPDAVRRAVHTFWQAFLATVALGLTPVLNALSDGRFNEAGTLLLALAAAAVATALSALKAYAVKWLQGVK